MMEGWEGYEPEPGYEDREMMIPYSDVEIRRGDIPEVLKDIKTIRQLTLFWDCEITGSLPYSGGFYEQPWYVCEIIRTLKRESAKRRERGG